MASTENENVGGKLLNGIKGMYVNILKCVRVKGVEIDCFRINRGVIQGHIVSPWLFNLYMDAVMKKVKRGWGGGELDFRRREESGDCMASCM